MTHTITITITPERAREYLEDLDYREHDEALRIQILTQLGHLPPDRLADLLADPDPEWSLRDRYHPDDRDEPGRMLTLDELVDELLDGYGPTRDLWPTDTRETVRALLTQRSAGSYSDAVARILAAEDRWTRGVIARRGRDWWRALDEDDAGDPTSARAIEVEL